MRYWGLVQSVTDGPADRECYRPLEAASIEAALADFATAILGKPVASHRVQARVAGPITDPIDLSGHYQVDHFTAVQFTVTAADPWGPVDSESEDREWFTLRLTTANATPSEGGEFCAWAVGFADALAIYLNAGGQLELVDWIAAGRPEEWSAQREEDWARYQ